MRPSAYLALLGISCGINDDSLKNMNINVIYCFQNNKITIKNRNFIRISELNYEFLKTKKII